jgi:uncharacterized protein (TIGR03435 family)
MVRRAVVLAFIGGIGSSSAPVLARQQPSATAFEVVSIRPASFPNDAYFLGYAKGAGNCGLWKFTPTGNRVSLRTVTLCMLMRMAYDVTDTQIVGLPRWSNQLDQSAWYQVEARAEEGTVLTLDQARERLRSLLAERFKLRFHREPRRTAVYALTVEREGHRLSNEEMTCAIPGMSFSAGPGILASCKPEMSISQLVTALAREVDRPVVDRTNLTGRYSFSLKWSPDPLATDAAPSIFTAIREQLGLRLEPSTELVDALVIDQVEPPSPN